MLAIFQNKHMLVLKNKEGEVVDIEKAVRVVRVLEANDGVGN